MFLPDDYYDLNNNKTKKTNNNINNTCALIGLKLNNKDMFKETPKNFMYYLMEYNSNKKNENRLNSFYWTIKYDNNNINDGYLSIGDPPHIYDPDNNYNEENFVQINTDLSYSSFYWSIQFNEIILQSHIDINNKTEQNIIYLKKYFDGHKCLFYPEINIFLGTVEYFNTIKSLFFNKFFAENICFEKNIYISQYNSSLIEGLNGQYIMIYCDMNKIEKYGKEIFYYEFPSLNFYYKLMNHSFIFNSNDLFYESKNENKIFFLICKKNNEVDQWIFGKIFLKKYQIVFNSEMKTIGFYINKNMEKSINDNDNANELDNNRILIIIILILIFIIILISIFLFLFAKNKINCFNRKKNATELDMINENSNLINT
jgi:hypothetical protein